MSIEIDSERCISCSKCVEICPNQVIEVKSSASVKDSENCTLCGLCKDVCPQDAIFLKNKEDFSEFTESSIKTEERYKEWSKTFSNILGLENSPVGIKLVSNKKNIPEEISSLETSLRYCEAINLGFKGIPFYFDSEYFACTKSKAAFGFCELPDKFRSGKVMEKQGFVQNKQSGEDLIKEIPMLEKKIEGVLVFPLKKTPLEPDVVLIKGKPVAGMWISKALIYHEEGPNRIMPSFAGEQASCSEATIEPIKEQVANFSLGCFGCRSTDNLGDEEMYIGIPINQVKETIDGLKNMKDRISDLN